MAHLLPADRRELRNERRGRAGPDRDITRGEQRGPTRRIVPLHALEGARSRARSGSISDGVEHWPIFLGRLQCMWVVEPSFTLGDGDIVTPEHAVEMFGTIPGAQLCVVPPRWPRSHAEGNAEAAIPTAGGGRSAP